MITPIWIALLARENEDVEATRKEIANKTLSLGIVPALDDTNLILPAGGQQANKENSNWLSYQMPKLPEDGKLSDNPFDRNPEYRTLDAVTNADILNEPGTVEITLPGENDLHLWDDLEPLEMGADDFPPTLEDTKLNERLVTWLRIGGNATAVNIRFLWIGINAVMISQRTRITSEVLPNGNGEPDQTAKLARSPIVPKSLRMFVTNGNVTEEWFETDDLLAAGSEVSANDLHLPPGAKKSNRNNPKVFTVNNESGEILFGDGLRGQRPPLDARIIVSYDFGAGIAGNVGAETISTAPAVPAGIKVSNPVRTWGGADSENVVDGEKQISRFLQHRERLVTAADFEKIVMRAPGVLIGRVEILPAFNPDLSPNEPGDAAGAVTIMVIPRYDVKQPDAPLPDRFFLDAICKYVDERRLITTEIFLRAPVYKPIWISVGINITADKSASEVRESVKQDLLGFLAPLNPAAFGLFNENNTKIYKGWQLRKPVTAKELSAVASRSNGVMFVNDILVAEGANDAAEQITMNGLELPRVMGISVSVGDPLPLSSLRGTSLSGTNGAAIKAGNARSFLCR